MYIHANTNILGLTKGNSSFLPVELLHNLRLLLKLYVDNIETLHGNTLQSVFIYIEQMYITVLFQYYLIMSPDIKYCCKSIRSLKTSTRN